MSSSLPAKPKSQQTSDDRTTELFDKYYDTPQQFASNDVDAVTGFFENRGWEKTAAVTIASQILTQAKIEGVKVFKILDTLKTLDKVQVSNLVATIMNNSRDRTSSIGYKYQSDSLTKEERRNIVV